MIPSAVRIEAILMGSSIVSQCAKLAHLKPGMAASGQSFHLGNRQVARLRRSSELKSASHDHHCDAIQCLDSRHVTHSPPVHMFKCPQCGAKETFNAEALNQETAAGNCRPMN